MTEPELKYRCDNCDWAGAAHLALNGKHPFIKGDTVLGCPRCREMELIKVCEIERCFAKATCACDAGGFKHVCGTHFHEFTREKRT